MISKEEAFIIRIYNKEGIYLEDFQEVEEHMGGGFCFDYTDNKEDARTFTKKELKHIEDVLIDEKYSILRFITPTPLDSEVEEALYKIERKLQECEHQNKPITRHYYLDVLTRIRQSLQDKDRTFNIQKILNEELGKERDELQSQLNQVREVCKLTVVNQSFKRCNEYFSYEAIEVIKQILGDDKE